MKPGIGGQSVRYLVLTVLTIVVLAPFASILLASVHSSDSQISGLSVPSEWSWSNFATAWNQGHFGRLVLASLIVAAMVVPLSVVLATLAGFSLALLRPPGTKGISLAFVLGMTLPIELVVVALYFNLQPMGLTNSYLGVALSEAALFMPFGVYWMQTHFSSIPRELVESARIDGARDLTVLCRILLPISWPAITTLCVLFFMWSWNQFLLVLVLIQDPERRTAPAGLGFFVGEFSTNIPLLSAASLIVIAPIVIVYLLFQRSFVSGITQGAVKG
ncbi:MAG: sugar ABC transporter permease [Microbacterium sp. 69-10]|mgnify:CR=1 FL=1|uniref:carbohydrate ABC transporter permease n=1 Tax=Microbacterium sp. 69-10 TaxID=1895783 RepID=UPI0009602A42|nr:carbohydrate ABC transporter permease [Microbacterium sp. 69-10]OJU39035.1 MAG: sugar ABC transporter permease [Microbacterium sp. 69-10]